MANLESFPDHENDHDLKSDYDHGDANCTPGNDGFHGVKKGIPKVGQGGQRLKTDPSICGPDHPGRTRADGSSPVAGRSATL